MTTDSKARTLAEKLNISMEKLEPKYIDSCDNTQELEKILRLLRSGEMGTYKHLERQCESKLEKVAPKSRLLRTETRAIPTKDVAGKEQIVDELKSWTSEMKDRDSLLTQEVGGGDAKLPPVRGSAKVVASGGNITKPAKEQKKKRSVPRDAKEWDRIISDLDKKEEPPAQRFPSPQIKNTSSPLPNQISTDGMCHEEIVALANREKDKGNEAFRSSDFTEAITYYNRSLSVYPTLATYNNRALAYIRANKWSDAVSDCNRVLSEEPDNIKGKLRRACAYKGLRKYRLAQEDLQVVLEKEPQNRRAHDMLKEVSKELQTQGKEKAQGKATRMIIEETDGESDEEMVSSPPDTQSSTTTQSAPSVNGNIHTSLSDNSQNMAPQHPDITEHSIPSTSAGPDQSETAADSQPAAVADSHPVAPDDSKNVDDTETKVATSLTNHTGAGSTEHVPNHENNPAAADCDQSNDGESGTIGATSLTKDSDQPLEPVEEEPKVITVPKLPDKADSLKAKGNEMFKAGRYDEAVGYYTQAIASLGADDSMYYHLSTLHSNRSACHIKIGDCRSAVEDCTAALELTANNTKALLRRATANEMLERYIDAYVDYRHAINMDTSATTAYTGARRCEQALSSEQGSKWRSKLPKIPSCSHLPVYKIEDTDSSKSFQTNQPRVADNQPSSTDEPKTPAPEQSNTSVESNEDKFLRLKDLGNKMVSKSDYVKANEYYTEAISLFPDRVAPYSNRALCNIKSLQPQLAIKDCDIVLSLEPAHIKALFRRAQANKMLENYKESLFDLMNLLKSDPNNVTAKKELNSVKAAYKEHLQSLPTTKKPTPAVAKQAGSKSTQPAAATKAPTRVVIEEGTDSEPETTTSSAAAATPSSTSKSKSRRKKKQAAKKAAKGSQPGGTAASGTESNVCPTLSANPTAFEFTNAWNAMKHVKETAPYAQLLRQIPPKSLASVLSNKLEAEMLEKLIACMNDHFTSDEMNNVELYLKSLSSVPRFSMITMFMSDSCKSALESLFSKLQPVSSQVDKLRIAFGM